MHKSIILYALLICMAAIVSHVQAHSAFASLNNFYSPKDDNVCCFPEKLTLENEIIQSVYSNSTYSVSSTNIRAFMDLTIGKVREDITELNGKSKSVFQSELNGNIVTHIIEDGRCKCSKRVGKIQRQCVSKVFQPRPVTILGEEAYKMRSVSNNTAFAMWVLKDTLKREGICWPMSIYTSNSIF